MKKTAISAAVCLIFLPALCLAQMIHEVTDEDEWEAARRAARTTEAGQYMRSSVSLLNVLAQRDAPIQRNWADILVRTVQDAIRMPRFDYNAISQTVVNQFLAKSQSLSIEERMNATVVPAVLSALEAEREIRAMGMLTEQQRNSFIVTKARELGITETELNAVMNSAFIFVVVFNGLERGRTQDGQQTVITLSAGGHWWRVDNSGETPKATLFEQIELTRRGIDKNPETAFQLAAGLIASEVRARTQSIPEFQLTGQIIGRTARFAEISIGRNEGVGIDDLYRVYESIENTEGEVRQRRRGWIMVTEVMSEEETESSLSRAQVISGAPYIGAIIREIPKLGLDASFQFAMAPRSIVVSGNSNPAGGNLNFSNVSVSNMFGVRGKIKMNLAKISRHFGQKGLPVSQLWLNMSGEYLWGSAEGEVTLPSGRQRRNLDGAESWGGMLSIERKWYIRRLALAPELGIGLNRIFLKTEEETTFRGTKMQSALSQTALGVFTNLGAELAISPFVNIGAFTGLNLYTGGNVWGLAHLNDKGEWVEDSSSKTGNSGNYRLRNTGMSWGIYFTVAVPAGRIL